MSFFSSFEEGVTIIYRSCWDSSETNINSTSYIGNKV